jgi:hypothetical protein
MDNAVGRTHKKKAARRFAAIFAIILVIPALLLLARIFGISEFPGILTNKRENVSREVNKNGYDSSVNSGAATNPKPGFANRPSSSARYRIPTGSVAVSSIKNGKQTVRIEMDETGFFPAVIIMQRGIKTDWTINGIKIGDRNRSLVFPKYYTIGNLREGENLLTIVPENDFDFAAIDYSFYGYVKVVDNIDDIDIDALKARLESFVPFIPDYYEITPVKDPDPDIGTDDKAGSEAGSEDLPDNTDGQEVPDVYEDPEASSCH